MSYRLSPLAEQDLDKIWSYVAEDASATTADHPRMGRVRTEFGADVHESACVV